MKYMSYSGGRTDGKTGKLIVVTRTRTCTSEMDRRQVWSPGPLVNRKAAIAACARCVSGGTRLVSRAVGWARWMLDAVFIDIERKDKE